ncbi:MAG: beta-ketoacyl-[acyl-carrier-protein] synthase family protein [Thermodesulfobacteriota bacterium]
MDREVVVTGLGLMSGLGLDLESSWQGLTAGASVTDRFQSFDPQGLDCTFGVELPAGVEELFKEKIKTRRRRQMTRTTMIGLVTSGMAIEDSDLSMDSIDPQRVGVVLGTTGTGYSPEPAGEDRMRIIKNMSNSVASWVSLQWKLHGPSYVVGTACSSGVYGLAAAHSMVSSGLCDVVISGSMDSSLNSDDVGGFSNLLALADDGDDVRTASRPFEQDRSGFVIGEGGGVLVVESRGHAEQRGARIYCRMHLPGLYTEAYNILSPEPEGRGMSRCMRQALGNSGLRPDDIDYINAHGTSTYFNDLYETQAIKEVFGDHARALPVSSTKSMTGHCLAGGGGMEAVISCKTLHEGVIPPTINLVNRDPELDLDYVSEGKRTADLNHVMSNSFAFGGHNGVNIFSRLDRGDELNG